MRKAEPGVVAEAEISRAWSFLISTGAATVEPKATTRLSILIAAKLKPALHQVLERTFSSALKVFPEMVSTVPVGDRIEAGTRSGNTRQLLPEYWGKY